MAGIPIGSSFRLTSPQPHLANASFPDAPTRLAQGQLRHVSWRYSQDSPDAHYRIKPLALCFLADNVTPAVQFDSWGTLEAHWRIMPVTSDDLPEGATNQYYTAVRQKAVTDLLLTAAQKAAVPADAGSTNPLLTARALGASRLIDIKTFAGRRVVRIPMIGYYKIAAPGYYVGENIGAAIVRLLSGSGAELVATTGSYQDLNTGVDTLFAGNPTASTRFYFEYTILANDETKEAHLLIPVAYAGTGTPPQSGQFLFVCEPQAVSFVALTQNQYGTHPAFSTQTALNAYLLGGAATVPTTTSPTFTAA